MCKSRLNGPLKKESEQTGDNQEVSSSEDKFGPVYDRILLVRVAKLIESDFAVSKYKGRPAASYVCSADYVNRDLRGRCVAETPRLTTPNSGQKSSCPVVRVIHYRWNTDRLSRRQPEAIARDL